MAITDIDISETLEAGAPSIKYSGNRDPNQMMMASDPNPMAEKNDMALEMFGKDLRLLSEEEMEILDEEIQRLRSKFMASGGRVQYGLGSLVKSIAKGAKKVLKSDLGKAALLAAGTYYGGGGNLFGLQRAGMTGFSLGNLPGASFFGKGSFNPLRMAAPSTADGFMTQLSPFGKALSKVGLATGVGGGSLTGMGKTALGSAGLASIYKAAGADVENPNELPRSTDELKELLKRGYKNLNPNASDIEVEEFVRVNSAQGGRIGYAYGTPDTMIADQETILETPNEEIVTNDMEEIQGQMAGPHRYHMILEGVINEMEEELNRELNDKEYEDASEEAYRRFMSGGMAQGGRIGYAFGTPDTAQAAGLMGNLPVRQNQAGVSEVDLRDTGGFIPPVGVKEKADDVPAMLSNNEFVFTADAVRAAGGGSVNKGAQRMYDLMKNLESKVV